MIVIKKNKNLSFNETSHRPPQSYILCHTQHIRHEVEKYFKNVFYRTNFPLCVDKYMYRRCTYTPSEKVKIVAKAFFKQKFIPLCNENFVTRFLLLVKNKKHF